MSIPDLYVCILCLYRKGVEDRHAPDVLGFLTSAIDGIEHLDMVLGFLAVLLDLDPAALQDADHGRLVCQSSGGQTRCEEEGGSK
jgi:hypothetical protein